jgi:predicted signal transduction protein with EAL and GGDEF domain
MRQTTTLPHLQRASLRDDGPCGWPAGGPVATLLLDAEDFRDLSDRLGGEAGDRLLVELADRLQERLCPCGVTTHLDATGLGIRCEGLLPGEPLTAEVSDALVHPLRLGSEVVEVRARLVA